MTFFESIYRLVLRLLPASFRTEHGTDALRMASARVREESGLRRWTRGCREVVDLLLSVPGLRRAAATTGGVGSQVVLPNGRGVMGKGVLSDLRWATKSLWRSRGFTSIAVGTLGVGIALSVAVTVAVNAYLVRGLPYPEADRLYSVEFTEPGGVFFLGLDRVDWSQLGDVLEHPISWDSDGFNLRGDPYPEIAEGAWVTPGYMAGYGVTPAQGRGFEPADYADGAPQVAIISHRLWQTRFSGASDIVGRRFEAYNNDRPDEPQVFTVVGVLARDFWHMNRFTEVLAPLRAPWYPYMARLERGVTPAVAVERITAVVNASGIARPEGWRVDLVSANDSYVAQIRPLLVALAAASVLVLLIACANVAVLFTVRATERAAEVAVRKALGASSGRVARTLASEALVLGAASTALGLALGYATVAATAPVLGKYLGRQAPGGLASLRIDDVALAGGLLAGALVTVFCGLVQWWAARRAPLSMAIGSGQKGASAGPGQRRTHAILIAVEVAACLTLLVGATMMTRSGLRILAVDMGLDTRGVVVGRFNLNQRAYPDAVSRLSFYDRVTADIEALAGSPLVAFATAWPLQGMLSREVSRDADPDGVKTGAGVVTVSGSYFDLLRIGIVDGRLFAASDRLGGEPVAVISRTLADRLWPGGRAVGERLRVNPSPAAPAGTAPTVRRVIGVVGDVRHVHTDDDLADVYVPMLQAPSAFAFMYLRARIDAPRLEQDVRGVLVAIDPDLALGMARPLGDILDQQRAGSRFLASLLVIFAAFAATLALVGIYGVIAYTVRQREREIALRLAIGAGRGVIVRLFLTQGAWVLGAGLALGAGGALLLGRVLESQLYGVPAADPMAIAAVGVAFAACGLAAMAWPARRAASTDPAIALKS